MQLSILSSTMTPERPLNQRADKVIGFVSSDIGNTRSKFVLRGGKISEGSRHTFVAIFKRFDGEDVLLTFGVGKDSISAFSLNRAVSKLTIPKEVEDLGIRDEADGALHEGFFGRYGMPVAVIAFGHTTDAEENSAELFTLPGISPQSALSRIKDAVFEATIRLN